MRNSAGWQKVYLQGDTSIRIVVGGNDKISNRLPSETLCAILCLSRKGARETRGNWADHVQWPGIECQEALILVLDVRYSHRESMLCLHNHNIKICNYENEINAVCLFR